MNTPNSLQNRLHRPEPNSLRRFLTNEPLAHFLGLAILLFAANAFFSGDYRELISVDLATQEYLVKQRQDLILRSLSEDEKDELIETFIEEEILVREARKRGLENTSRIRSLLLRNMHFLMADEIPDPSEADLRAFFKENPAQFETSPSVTYEHVFFADPKQVPVTTLEELRTSVDFRSMGDADFNNQILEETGEQQILKSFGRTQAQQILAIRDELWHGPFVSDSGIHYLRIAEYHDAFKPDYEQARNWLEKEWRFYKNRQVIDRKLGEIRKNYRIEVNRPDKAGT